MKKTFLLLVALYFYFGFTLGFRNKNSQLICDENTISYIKSTDSISKICDTLSFKVFQNKRLDTNIIKVFVLMTI